MLWHLTCICSSFYAYTTLEGLVFMVCLINQTALLLVLLGVTSTRSRTSHGVVYVPVDVQHAPPSLLFARSTGKRF